MSATNSAIIALRGDLEATRDELRVIRTEVNRALKAADIRLEKMLAALPPMRVIDDASGMVPDLWPSDLMEAR